MFWRTLFVKIRKMTIKNFRGVKELDWCLPTADIFCLIGKGDSSKSTLLEAIRYAFYPQWNLSPVVAQGLNSLGEPNFRTAAYMANEPSSFHIKHFRL
jgi:predicted ATP-dependent endonuclease of OLD family